MAQHESSDTAPRSMKVTGGLCVHRSNVGRHMHQ
jgi:hypothetical protein